MRTGFLIISLLLVAAATCFGQTIIGVPADFATIQEAIDLADPGAVVSIAPGTYVENLHIEKSVRLEAETPGAVVVTPSAWDAPAVLVEASAEDARVEFYGLEFADAWGERALAVDSTSTVIVSACEFRGNFVDILTSVSSTIEIRECHFEGYFDTCIRVANGATLTISNSTFVGTTKTVIVEGRLGATIDVTDCEFSAVGTTGVQALLAADNGSSLHAANVVVTDLYHGTAVEIQDASSAIVESCRFERCARGIEILNVAHSSSNTTLQALTNRIEDCYIGIRLAGYVELAEISDNAILDSGLRAIIIVTPTCADAYNPTFAYSGVITGTGNSILRSYKGGCPPFGTPFWPDGFVD